MKRRRRRRSRRIKTSEEAEVEVHFSAAGSGYIIAKRCAMELDALAARPPGGYALVVGSPLSQVSHVFQGS